MIDNNRCQCSYVNTCIWFISVRLRMHCIIAKTQWQWLCIELEWYWKIISKAFYLLQSRMNVDFVFLFSRSLRTRIQVRSPRQEWIQQRNSNESPFHNPLWSHWGLCWSSVLQHLATAYPSPSAPVSTGTHTHTQASRVQCTLTTKSFNTVTVCCVCL